MTISPISPQMRPYAPVQAQPAEQKAQENYKKEPIITSKGLVVTLMHLGAFLTIWGIHRRRR